MVSEKNRGGRPKGSKKVIENNTLVKRVREASGLIREDFARQVLKCGTSTVARYELKNLAPALDSDEYHRLIEAAKKYNVPPEEA